MRQFGFLLRTAFAAVTLALAGAAAPGMPGPALAAGGGGGGGDGGPPKCKAGWVPDASGQYCVKAQSSLEDRQRLDAGRALALAGDYDRALTILAAADQGEPMVLTMIGYAKRKSGALEEGIAYYHRALAIDPDSADTREYLGEGYVAMGRLDLAQAELDRIGTICGETCDQYLDLAAAMAGDMDWTPSAAN